MKKLLKFIRQVNLYQILLHISLLVLAVEVLILARQNRELKTSANQTPGTIKIGDYFSIKNLMPLQPNYTYDSTSQQLLFVFNTRCPFCKRNFEHWKKIVEQVKERNIYIAGISLHSLEKTMTYASNNQIHFKIFYTGNEKQFRKENNVTGVPKTILRNSIGKVEQIWSGLLSDDDVAEIINTISLNKHITFK